jgi:hypothetical protein
MNHFQEHWRGAAPRFDGSVIGLNFAAKLFDEGFDVPSKDGHKARVPRRQIGWFGLLFTRLAGR